MSIVIDALATTPSSGATTIPAAGETDTSDWIVLQTIDAAGSQTRRALPDCAVVVPGKGVLALTVECCTELRRVDEGWLYGDDGKPDPRGPFRRAADVARRLRERVTERNRQFTRVPVWSAVCLPNVDVDQDVDPVEWHHWQVIDRDALRSQPLARLVETALDEARALLVADQIEWFHPERHEPRPGQCDALVEQLRAEFEAVNALD